jgi:glutamate-ammonia-ligase adenylyltransferase
MEVTLDSSAANPGSSLWPLFEGRSFSMADTETIRRAVERLDSKPERTALLGMILPRLADLLAASTEPGRVMASFELLIDRSANPQHTLQVMADNPRALEILARLFAGSQFLTEILLRNPAAFERLLTYRRLSRPKSVEQLYTEIQAALGSSSKMPDPLDTLRRVQSEEMLRIGACDLLDLFDLPAVTRQLSNLADALIRTCLKLAAAQEGGQPEQLIVLGMGKLGGSELNYSSDIDLLFLTESDSAQAMKLGQKLIDILAHVTSEGFLYRVDMRLRPWGAVGPLTPIVASYKTYLEKNARLWEKQALLKARAIAGDTAAGRDLLEQVRPMLFTTSIHDLQEAVFSMKQRTEEQLRRNGKAWGEVKLGEGSIRDVEFTVQFLQMAYGAAQPEILSSNTLDALVRLASAGLLRQDEYRILSEGYVFLRTIEHYLQMMHYRQTHSLPEDPANLAALARRLGFNGERPGVRFVERYQQHGAAIRAVYLRYVGGSRMNHLPEPNSDSSSAQGHSNPLQIHWHLDRMAPSYAEIYKPDEIARHAALAGRLNDANPAEVDATRVDDLTWLVTVVAYDFPGELSVITGLMFVYGLNIVSGEAFTYETARETKGQRDTRRKIVDVFRVLPVEGKLVGPETWASYAADLASFHALARGGRRNEMLGDLTRRVAMGLQGHELEAAQGVVPALYPIHIEIDNEASDSASILRIDAQDTVGFLYEFTNALAISGVYIDRVVIDTVGSRVQDVLFVTDANGRKITAPDRLRELRAATVLIKHFTHLLPFSPNPESALVHFRDFIDQLFHRPNWTDELTSVQRPEVLQALAGVLGVSDFLWDDFLRMQYTNLFPVVTDTDALETAKSHAQLQAELSALLQRVHAGPQAPREDSPWIDTLLGFRDREMFRIDMRHILGHTREFWDFAAELSDLAEVVTNTAYYLCHEDLRLVYGDPLKENGTPCQMCVVALGKFGGRELGFASDVELMFIYEDNGHTSGPRSITTAEFYEKLVESFVASMKARREGIFQVDLQLRPYGKAGSMAVSLESFRRYFGPGGPAWAYERQALVKLTPVAGDQRLGSRVATLRDEFVYTGESFDVTAMRAMRERQTRHLVKGGTFHPKFSQGGLVDVEYLVQGLQITHGRDNPTLRYANTREAMAALNAARILSEEDYTRLRKAHTFLRWLIDSLRVVRGNAKDITLPDEGSEEFAFLARRMRYGDDLQRLRQDLVTHTTAIREINRRLLG